MAMFQRLDFDCAWARNADYLLPETSFAGDLCQARLLAFYFHVQQGGFYDCQMTYCANCFASGACQFRSSTASRGSRRVGHGVDVQLMIVLSASFQEVSWWFPQQLLTFRNQQPELSQVCFRVRSC